ncbi:COP9 signalosome complex subunit 8-like [Sitophilus oryzae]|uniref:COP9 signalosome complex subunit 8-like n=1 Tax=Sitophilus oryzae TaxID=7048 RepID=A0A6J2YI25_SITOR|nr:COP9 signalosome complex subunit 8-like [Sitophilus oryzae]XP_030762926.1 COP9 signalosome complex subunit 8-like [Sitophilus oryzae]
MFASNIDKIVEDLERQELEAPTGIASPQVYSRLLAFYLYQNDLCNAKFLWKRIPSSIKSSNPEIGCIWTVGQHLWKSDFTATYTSLNAVSWSDTVSEIMKNVQDVVRSRAVDLISQAYSSITLDTVSAMTGLPPDVCAAACSERGWRVEHETKMIYPIRKIPDPIVQPSSEDQLYKLTDFVSFLEN